MDHHVEIRECVAVSEAKAAEPGKLCLECLAPIKGLKDEAVFCSVPCRKTFNNRRAVRGAVIYDLLMAWRYQRGLARAASCFSLICALGKQYREEDVKLHGHGWRSWLDPEAVYAAKPWMRSLFRQR